MDDYFFHNPKNKGSNIHVSSGTVSVSLKKRQKYPLQTFDKILNAPLTFHLYDFHLLFLHYTLLYFLCFNRIDQGGNRDM